MKKLLLGLILSVSLPVMAVPVNIADNYVGGDDHGYGDVIGSVTKFGISSMDVSMLGSLLTVQINTQFASQGLGTYGSLTNTALSCGQGIGFGDLFLSSNGWNPSGSAPYMNDDHSNGEVWEYGISLTDRWSTTSGSALYALSGSNNDSAYLSQDFLNSGVFRDGQEVAVDVNGGYASLLGNLTLFSTTANSITFSLDTTGTSLANASSIGIHWGMTCGNDTIEGEYNIPSVPEPATVMLMLLGLACLLSAGMRRKNLAASIA